MGAPNAVLNVNDIIIGQREIEARRVIHEGREYVVIPKEEYDELVRQNRILKLLLEQVKEQNEELKTQNKLLTDCLANMEKKQVTLSKDIKKLKDKTDILLKVTVVAVVAAVIAVGIPVVILAVA